MHKITYKQLKSHYEKVMKLNELKSWHKGLVDHHSDISQSFLDSELVDRIASDIAVIEKKIAIQNRTIDAGRFDIMQGLSCIKDDVSVSAIIWHYCYGMTWGEIAYITKYGSENSIKVRVHRALKKAGII